MCCCGDDVKRFSIPQQAALIAYEKFLYIALISIVESLLKLGASIILIFILYKKLIIYSLCYVLISFLFVGHMFFLQEEQIEH